ncbi:hypothetical protein FOA52_007074 [Chlamydomonas sp. UWO 241]|nr:hypothetical protein FOA52_007074 [Chlamydomonas sp. UWO 241]
MCHRVIQQAACALSTLAQDAVVAITIAAAGAIQPHVRLLGADCHEVSRYNACGALMGLAQNHWCCIVIALAGAVPPLVRLLGRNAPHGVPQIAAGALWMLAHGNAENSAAIAAAGAIPLLVLLLRPGSPALAQRDAAGALGALAQAKPDTAATIAAAGAIPPLVQLLGPARVQPRGCPWSKVQLEAALALMCLSLDVAEPIRRVGSIPALQVLLRSAGLDHETRSIASQTLWLLEHHLVP